jgi:hypothetical protein|tara:strand:+ start:2995 stop:4296 length:1302 start_codon:yes stop_codon:yes gene_type:complete
MNREFLKEAIADAKAVKESAIANAKVALEEAFTPQLKSMLAAKLEEMDSADEDDVKEMRGSSYEEDDSMREEMTDPDMRHGEDEDGKPEAGALKATEMDRKINEDEEVNLDEILAEIDNEISEDEETDAEEEGYDDGMEDEKEDMEDDELNLDDMSDDDLKSFIEDVIADMVSAGELEAGTEFEAKDEEVEVEVEDEIEISEEMKDEDKMEEAVGNPISTSVKRGQTNKYDEDFMKAVKGDVKQLSSTLKDSLKKALGISEGDELEEINTSASVNLGYTKGNKYDEDFMKAFKGDISKLSQSLKDKLKGLFKEEMELEEAYNTINVLKSELHEVNLLNAKLLYTNKIFKSKSLTEKQKGKVLEAFDKANDVKGVKLVYETLDKNMKVKYKSSVTEGIVGSASRGISNVKTSKKQPIVESNEMVSRFQKLAGIK